MSDTPIHCTKPYWEDRVKAGVAKNDYKEMIFADARFDAFTQRVKKLLSLWHDGYSVLDVACGYGRFSDGFQDYTGIDFCEGMVELARKKYPNRNFLRVHDAKTWNPKRKFDVVFEVNSLKSLGLNTSHEFFDRFSKYASKYIVTLEVDDFYICHMYEHNKSW